MNTVCERDKCVACMACLEACGKNAIKVIDELRVYNAVINLERCVNCGDCHRICQNNQLVETSEPVKWYQGWAKDERIRCAASSGGIATAIAKAFIEKNGIVCSCVFIDGSFRFDFANQVDDIKKFIGSKYVKSSPVGIYKKIKQQLANGQKILFTGLPCQVAALKNFVGEKLEKNLYTVDLICHGTPSPENLKAFLEQSGYQMKNIKDISFRNKVSSRHIADKEIIVEFGALDHYTLAFLNSLNYTESCYYCQYAKLKRVSDLTIGDSWGSTLSDEEKKKGISLVLCMSNKGMRLLEQANLHLEAVDLKRAIRNNNQLVSPCVKPQSYDEFIEGVKHGIQYKKLVINALPKQCRNQILKRILYKFKLLRNESDYQITLVPLEKESKEK